MLADVARRVQAIRPVTLDGVEAELQIIAGRLDKAFTAPVDPLVVEAMGARLEVVHGLMLSQTTQLEAVRRWTDAGGPPPPDFSMFAAGMAALREQVDVLSRSIETSKPRSSEKLLGALSSQLDDARREIVGLRDVIEGQGRLIADLSDRLTAVQTATLAALTPPPPAVEAVEQTEPAVTAEEASTDIIVDDTAALVEAPDAGGADAIPLSMADPLSSPEQAAASEPVGPRLRLRRAA
jgi:hypothetical protein